MARLDINATTGGINQILFSGIAWHLFGAAKSWACKGKRIRLGILHK